MRIREIARCSLFGLQYGQALYPGPESLGSCTGREGRADTLLGEHADFPCVSVLRRSITRRASCTRSLAGGEATGAATTR